MNIVLRLLIGIAAAVGTLALLEVFVEQTPAQITITCMEAEDRNHVKELTIEGLDQALKNRAAHLFEVWMTDYTDQPKRARVGIQRAIAAYAQARKDASSWNPPPCGDK